jgi:hypothetical protein
VWYGRSIYKKLYGKRTVLLLKQKQAAQITMLLNLGKSMPQ